MLWPLSCTMYPGKRFPLRPLSLFLSPSFRCSPGGEVQWSVDTLAHTRPSQSCVSDSYQVRKGRKNLEQRKRHDKKPGGRCAPGLLLGRALQSVCLKGQNKPCNRAGPVL